MNQKNIGALTYDNVLVWIVDQAPTGIDWRDHLETLPSEEQTRVGKFAFEKLQRRFVFRRAALRKLLGHYLNVAPEQVKLELSEYGKPTLAAQYQESQIQFNISTSEDLALIGITKGRKLGVDIEYHKRHADYEKIAQRFFSPAEVIAFLDLPQDQRLQGFYNCWTRKEAFIKAIGQGLSYPLKDFDITLKPGEQPKVLCVKGGDVNAWKLAAFTPAEDFTAAVAATGGDWTLEVISFTW
ncbi:MAG: 4'-phosphopantetheinyl transferase superfamily protein [Anaerolineales bacterium]|nr:4'-phosphopantetheinyl transferase superfamily protein [Anaerolineales bacterium]